MECRRLKPALVKKRNLTAQLKLRPFKTHKSLVILTDGFSLSAGMCGSSAVVPSLTELGFHFSHDGAAEATPLQNESRPAF
jgi:hypothetical protein